MKVTALMYHDVVGEEGFAGSGFAGGDAHIYKLTRDAFAAHLAAISAVVSPAPVAPALLETIHDAPSSPPQVALTFDDGGVGAITHAAPLLESAGWRGHFFVTTDWIGRPGFLNAAQVAELHRRGHVIGSHSCSHPPRISACDDAQLALEWRDSVRLLGDIVGAPITVASVPGGYYSDRVADAARAAGVRVLFTSEPTRTVRHRGDLALVGRLTLMRDDPPALARAFASGERLPALRQAALWSAKKVVKRVGGERWLAFRRRFFHNH